MERKGIMPSKSKKNYARKDSEYTCTIVMYHYVRDFMRTRYPKIKGISISMFQQQLLYLKENYNFIRAKDMIAAIHGDPLPPRAVWLTFDDGYIDHYANVFPILDSMGIEGAFFVPAKAILSHKVLDVNKIHFVLASIKNLGELILDIYHQLDVYRMEYSLESNEYYFRKLAVRGRFDDPEIVFVKRLLQRELPEEVRKKIVDSLFQKYVTEDEVAFSQELYMNEDQIKCMLRHGMHFGNHGYEHYWLNSLSPEQQVDEIKKSLDFLYGLGVAKGEWIMNYPYGAYNETLIDILRDYGCVLGITTRVGVANLRQDNLFSLPRLDTKDLPLTVSLPGKGVV